MALSGSPCQMLRTPFRMGSKLCIHHTCDIRRSRAVYVNAVESPRSSLVPITLEEMEADTELQQHFALVKEKGQAALSREEKMKRQRSLDSMGLPSFYALCKERGVSPLVRKQATTLQLNIGLYCNQACNHCHVESSPKRTEMMDRRTAERCMQLIRAGTGSITTVDITGGAPELNAQFRYLVQEARALGLEVIDRCNLTVLLEPGQEDLPQFLAEHRVRVVASLPCYSQKNVDQQRGAGVFERSIQALQILNAHGYGQLGTGLKLDLVYNPGGAFLAPSQASLEAAYKQELQEAYGIVFSQLLALNNMPIKRFVDFLQRRNQLDDYMKLLVDNFNPSAAEGVMCRDTVSVGWDGRLYDCDFNQQLEMGVMLNSGSSSSSSSSNSTEAVQPASSSSSNTSNTSSSQAGSKPKKFVTVFDIQSLDELTGRPIHCDNHCFGCTSGSGSSCQGATL